MPPAGGGAAGSHRPRLRDGLLLLVTGAFFDKEIFAIEYGRLFEELAETNAYLFLALPALYELYYGFKKSLHLRAGGNLGVKAEET